MTSEIPIAEQFYSIQGEGNHAGTPAVFLRLAGCNLVCGGWENRDRDPEEMIPEDGATWVCDTIDVWREAQRSLTPEEMIEDWKARGFLQSIQDGAHLVLTGGEPMLEGSQTALLGLIAEMLREDVSPFIEVETNGTQQIKEDLAPYIDQWNISLKLSNSGMPEEERINQEALEFFRHTHEETEKDVTFKFVASRQDDVGEILDLVRRYKIPEETITLMPAGQRQDQLRRNYPVVADICKRMGWDFSPRLQVDTWDQATGV